MSANCETLNDLRGMMVIMREAGARGVIRFTVTRTYASEIWSELYCNGVELPAPRIGNTMDLEFKNLGCVTMEVM